MSKLKTSKSVLKRLKISAGGKIRRRHAGIDHFSATDSGSAKRHRRTSQTLAKQDRRNVKNLLPYLVSFQFLVFSF